jgi:hypothetical protein
MTDKMAGDPKAGSVGFIRTRSYPAKFSLIQERQDVRGVPRSSVLPTNL